LRPQIARLVAITVLCLLPVSLLSSSASTVVYLVRHAEKASNDRDPLLSEAGQKRAECLATMLADSGIESIYTTEFKRTQLTAEPLAKKLGLAVVPVPGADVKGVAEKIAAEAGKTVLVVGHSNTVPTIIEKLGVGTKVTMADSEYDRMFIVTLNNGVATMTSLRYCVNKN
jgi:broad specificity phosphatase PhoE